MKLRFDRDTRRRWKSHAISAAALGCVIIALIPLVSILAEATSRGLHAVGPAMFTENQPPPCNPETSATCSTGGIANAIQGTLILISLAALISLPAGVLTGVYVSEYGNNRLGRTVRFFTDILTEIPSIVVGIFVYTLLLESANLGWVDVRLVFSTIAGVLALAVIMVPIVARTSEEALRLVPTATREAALALGIPKYRVTLRIVLSSARSGLLTGSLLAVARAAGETAPLIMTAFGNPFGFQGLNQPIEAMPRIIFYYGISPFPNWQELAWGSALVLVLLMLSISVVARVLLRSRFGVRGVPR
ncbi:MAG TPA: phosphate ABC transporter permease PstA [Thermoplasmata archaeon]|jgi:phosphate transport system permease protein